MPKIRYALLTLACISSLSFGGDTSLEKPKKKMTLQDLINSAAGSSQNSANVAGVRGLEETDKTVDTQARDFVALERLERVVIHDEDVRKFIDEGKLK